jgi:hypothetical protein
MLYLPLFVVAYMAKQLTAEILILLLSFVLPASGVDVMFEQCFRMSLSAFGVVHHFESG